MRLKHKLGLLAAGSVLFSTLAALLCSHLLRVQVIEPAWRAHFQDLTDGLALPLSTAAAAKGFDSLGCGTV